MCLGEHTGRVGEWPEYKCKEPVATLPCHPPHHHDLAWQEFEQGEGSGGAKEVELMHCTPIDVQAPSRYMGLPKLSSAPEDLRGREGCGWNPSRQYFGDATNHSARELA